MAATCRYSRTVYDAPPSSNCPAMTGAIFPDLAKVATGKLNPLAKASDVNALEHTCVAPET